MLLSVFAGPKPWQLENSTRLFYKEGSSKSRLDKQADAMAGKDESVFSRQPSIAFHRYDVITVQMNTAEKLIDHALRYFNMSEVRIKPQDDIFESLGIDSVQVLELLSELELMFDVEIPDYELRGVKTFEQLAEQIDKRI